MWDTKKIQLYSPYKRKKNGSVCAVWLDCIIKYIFAEEFWTEAKGVIAKILVYLNGLPFRETVRMCNHWKISVQNELTGWSKWKAPILSGCVIWKCYHPPHGIYSKCCSFLMIVSFTVSFHLCCVYQLNSIRYYCFYSQMHLVHFDSES